jgi:hypothetical protein
MTLGRIAMAERSDVYAYFWVEGFDCGCEDITTQMKIAPSRVQQVGDVLPSGRAAQANRWELLSPLARGENLLQQYLEALVGVLEPRAHVIQTLASRYSAGINCVGYYYGSNPGLHFSASLIERIAALKVAVDFDLYNYGEEDAA